MCTVSLLVSVLLTQSLSHFFCEFANFVNFLLIFLKFEVFICYIECKTNTAFEYKYFIGIALRN